MNEETETIARGVVIGLLDRANPGDHVRVYDGWESKFLGEFTIPDTSSIIARRRRAGGHVGKILKAMKRTSSVRAGSEGEVRLPQFLELVSSNLRSGAGDLRVIILGGPYYSDPRDEGFTFGKGHYPSPGHVLADQLQSIYGASGRNGVLSGCVIHFCYLGDGRFQNGLEKTAIRKFWHYQISELGGCLSSFSSSPEDVLRRALAGVKDPVLPNVEIDRNDTVIEMRRVGAAPKPKPATVIVSAKAPASTSGPELPILPDPPNASYAPHLAIWIDGSASMGERLAETTKEIKATISIGASMCGEIKVTIFVYRGPGQTDILPLTTVREQRTAQPDEGMVKVLGFLENKVIRIDDASHADGFRMVSRMHPRDGIVDVASALRTGMTILRASAAKDAPLLLVVISDTGPWEFGALSVIEEEERATANALKLEMAEFARTFKNADVLTVFAGHESHSLATETVAFFRGLAGAAGSRGSFTKETSMLTTKALEMFSKAQK